MLIFYSICFILASCSISIGCSAESFGWDDVVRNNLKVQSRIKRNADTCAKSCIDNIGENINKHFPDGDDLHDIFSNPKELLNLTKPQFNILCRNVAEPFLTCFEKCPPSNLTEILQNMLRPMKYICVVHFDLFYEKFDCFNETNTVIEEQCHHRLCQHLNPHLDITPEEMRKRLEEKDFQGLRNLFGDVCNYTSCMMPCENGVTAKFCDAKITNLIYNEFLPLTMETLKTMLDTINPELWPQECQIFTPDPANKSYK